MLKLTRELWTDGSVHPNPGFGGWSVVDHNGDLVTSGYGYDVTNIVMEGYAIDAAMTELGDEPGIIWTDSQLWVNVLTKFAYTWERKGWEMPNKNRALIMDMFAYLKDHHLIELKWVRGHNGDPNNEAADHFANEARRQGWEAAQKRKEARR